MIFVSTHQVLVVQTKHVSTTYEAGIPVVLFRVLALHWVVLFSVSFLPPMEALAFRLAPTRSWLYTYIWFRSLFLFFFIEDEELSQPPISVTDGQ